MSIHDGITEIKCQECGLSLAISIGRTDRVGEGGIFDIFRRKLANR